MLETKCVGDKFEMLVTDIEKITKKVANIIILPPISEISLQHNVTNITVTIGQQHFSAPNRKCEIISQNLYFWTIRYAYFNLEMISLTDRIILIQ